MGTKNKTSITLWGLEKHFETKASQVKSRQTTKHMTHKAFMRTSCGKIPTTYIIVLALTRINILDGTYASARAHTHTHTHMHTPGHDQKIYAMYIIYPNVFWYSELIHLHTCVCFGQGPCTSLLATACCEVHNSHSGESWLVESICQEKWGCRCFWNHKCG